MNESAARKAAEGCLKLMLTTAKPHPTADELERIIEAAYQTVAPPADGIFERCCRTLCVFCNEIGTPHEQNAVLTANGEPFWHKDGAVWRKCQASILRKSTNWIMGAAPAVSTPPNIEHLSQELADACFYWREGTQFQDCKHSAEVMAVVLRKHLSGAVSTPRCPKEDDLGPIWY